MKIEALNRAVVDLLRDNIDNPTSNTAHWVYMDYPRSDATFPRISVTLVSSAINPAWLGNHMLNDAGEATQGMWVLTTYDIDIWVERTNRTTGIDPIRGGTALRDYIVDLVETLILEKKETMRTEHNVVDMEIIDRRTLPYDETTQLFRATLVVRITHDRTFNPG